MSNKHKEIIMMPTDFYQLGARDIERDHSKVDRSKAKAARKSRKKNRRRK